MLPKLCRANFLLFLLISAYFTPVFLKLTPQKHRAVAGMLLSKRQNTNIKFVKVDERNGLQGCLRH